MKFDNGHEEKYAKRFALDKAKDYFSAVIAECDRMKRNVESYQKRFDEAVHVDNSPSMATDVLEWASLAVQQFNNHSERCVRAAVAMTSAFDVRKY